RRQNSRGKHQRGLSHLRRSIFRLARFKPASREYASRRRNPHGHRRSLHAGLEIQGLLVADPGGTRRQIGFVRNVISPPAHAVLRTAMRGHDEGTGWTSCGLLTRFAPCRCCLASRTTTRFAASFSGGVPAPLTSLVLCSAPTRRRSTSAPGRSSS